MKKGYKLKGTVEEQLKYTETMLNRLGRKARQTTTFAVPGVPVSFYDTVLPEGGTFNYLNSFSGKTKSFYFYCAKIKDVDEITFTITARNKAGGQGYEFYIKPGKLVEVPQEVMFKAGDRLTIGHNHPEEIKDLWIGFSIFPDKKYFDYTQLCIDTLLKEDTTDEGI